MLPVTKVEKKKTNLLLQYEAWQHMKSIRETKIREHANFSEPNNHG